MADFKKYCNEIHDNLDYFALWLPTEDPIQVGDYGTMEGDRLNVLGNIRDLGVVITSTNDDGTYDSITYQSSSGLSFNSKVGGKVSSVGSGSISVSFSKKDSIFLVAEDITYGTMNNITKLGELLNDLKKDNKWKSSYVFVSKRIVSRRCFVAIADSSSSSFSLSGSVSRAVTGVADVSLSGMVVSSASSVS